MWKDVLRLKPTSADVEVLALVAQCLDFEGPWTTRIVGVLGILLQRLGTSIGVSVYAPLKVGGELYAAASAGLAGPLSVAWGAPLAGLAASERAAQFAGDARAFPDYQGGWLGVASVLAVPIMRAPQLYGVLEVRSHGSGSFGVDEAELTGLVASQLADRWPARQGAAEKQ
ncbi:GAF domain-containing protein [Sulfobacillus harzensis]|uniref:GAF domain-containing protein n=1 Tax=Sulfobacillus harzensis TaxID=2729629 RepID=A0A7Y0Q1A9_9FIRM|nr:GAF domain-containing protein [Sulfobacillus harzensis]NMP21903.1 GAF domain-containing protein [Sulfobacillus harzensis]